MARKFSFVRSHLDSVVKRVRGQGLQRTEGRTIQVEGIADAKAMLYLFKDQQRCQCLDQGEQGEE